MLVFLNVEFHIDEDKYKLQLESLNNKLIQLCQFNSPCTVHLKENLEDTDLVKDCHCSNDHGKGTINLLI